MRRIMRTMPMMQIMTIIMKKRQDGLMTVIYSMLLCFGSPGTSAAMKTRRRSQTALT